MAMTQVRRALNNLWFTLPALKTVQFPIVCCDVWKIISCLNRYVHVSNYPKRGMHAHMRWFTDLITMSSHHEQQLIVSHRLKSLFFSHHIIIICRAFQCHRPKNSHRQSRKPPRLFIDNFTSFVQSSWNILSIDIVITSLANAFKSIESISLSSEVERWEIQCRTRNVL